uniref:Uncharacterized protein n=1 Tax=Opuntia streptacantha TaxID=393608 RepID=A0A7C9A6A6_OPUST
MLPYLPMSKCAKKIHGKHLHSGDTFRLLIDKIHLIPFAEFRAAYKSSNASIVIVQDLITIFLDCPSNLLKSAMCPENACMIPPVLSKHIFVMNHLRRLSNDFNSISSPHPSVVA